MCIFSPSELPTRKNPEPLIRGLPMLPNLTAAFVLLVTATTAAAADYEPFLRDHQAVWDSTLQNPGAVLTDSLLANQIFLIGEAHGIAATYSVQYDLIEYLQGHAGVRYLLLELAYLDGYFINRYLATGGTTYIDHFLSPYRETFSWSKDMAGFLGKLRALNLSLPEDRRLIVLPLDLEFGHRRAITWLCDSLFTPADSAGILLRTLQPQTDSAAKIIRVFTEAWEHFTAHDSLYRHSLADRYAETAYLMRNVHARYDLHLSGLQDQRRDSVMLDNLNFWRDHYSITTDKMVGLFGSYHIVQFQDPGDARLGAILREIAESSRHCGISDVSTTAAPPDTTSQTGDTRRIDGVVSFYPVYDECMQMFPGAQADDTLLSRKYYQLVRYFSSGMDGDTLLAVGILRELNAGRPASLFLLPPTDAVAVPASVASPFLPATMSGRRTEEAFQVIIFVHGSPAAEPYGVNERTPE